MKPTLPRALAALAVLLLLVHLALNLELSGDQDPTTPGHQGDLEDDRVNIIAIPLTGSLFAFASAVLLIGWRGGLLFFAVTAVLSWTAEELGVRTGLLFGHYEYGNLLGPKLGSVPWVIPAYWFMLVYVSYIVAILISREALGEAGSSLLQIVWTSLVAGLTATAYDLGLDPYMSSASVGAWTWFQDASKSARFTGGYFDVPASNFISWTLVTAVIVTVARRLLRRIGSRPIGRWPHLAALLPVVFYLGFWCSHLSDSYDVPVRVISLVAMGIPAMAALSGWRIWKDSERRFHGAENLRKTPADQLRSFLLGALCLASGYAPFLATNAHV